MDESTYEYLKPTDDQMERMARVRAAAKAYSEVLEAEMPDGPDKTFVIRAHRSNAMWCNVVQCGDHATPGRIAAHVT